MFKNVPNPPKFPEMEKDLLKKWEEDKIFQRSIDQNIDGEDYVFYDGPPGTNGTPHVGHLMQSSLKDLWPRFWTMRGKRVLRKAGWDTHGLPIELTADRDLGFKSKADIEEFGIEKYIEHCRNTVFRFKGEWEEAIHRLGRFVDLDDFYATYKTSYIQSDWWVLKQAWDTKVKDEFVNPTNLAGQDRFLYKDYRVSAWCPKQGTTLSNFEVAQGYKDVVDIALFPKFKLVGEENTSLVAWTTTAWTLLSNLAISVGPKMEYVKIEMKNDAPNGTFVVGEKLIMAKSRLEALDNFLGGKDNYTVLETLLGKALDGKKYEPLWEFQEIGENENGHIIVADDYVTDDDGTGLVHMAPYGEDDYRIIKKNKINVTLRVNVHGLVNETNYLDWDGKWFKDQDLEISILRDLKSRGLLFAKEKHAHTYPHNYKTGTPLIYFPRPGWFIRTTAMRDELLEANKQINWYPEHIREGRFGKWLENVVDWNITRERFWGSPLPLWTSEDSSQSVAFGSIAELNEYLVKQGDDPLPEDADLHKPGIDEIVLKGENGVELRRENFVLDSWFNAGIMPWGQVGYPAAEGSVEYLENQFPCDFICEGLDQTRGWFYSLLAISTMLAIARKDEDKSRWSSYKNVICTDLVLDATGEKMSKSKGNVVPPIPMMDKYGADAVRWSFYKNNPWLPVRFGEDALKDSLRQIFIPLWNAYSFFVTYAKVDGWEPDNCSDAVDPTLMDRWILTCYNDTLSTVTEKLEKYDVMPAASSITDFLDRLTNWYIRRSRRRFWKSDEIRDKERAYRTLYKVLVGMSKLLAPFAPFISESIYKNMVQNGSAKDSVHLEDWPKVDESLRDDKLKASMDYVRSLVSVGRAAREAVKIKVRQPLGTFYIVAEETQHEMIAGLEDLIHDELNVKTIEYVDTITDMISYSAKANFPVLGPRFGKDMKIWAGKIAAVDPDTAVKWAKNESVEIDGEVFENTDVTLIQEIPDHLVLKEEGEAVIAIDTTLSESLLAEGYVRELINRIQNLRKEIGLEVSQRISLSLACDSELLKAVEVHNGLIAKEVLARTIEVSKLDNEHDAIKINDRLLKVDISPLDD